MQAHLSWPQAAALTATGSVVRRAGWLTRSIFKTRGDLYWLNAPDGSQRVITASDFTRADYLALDYTDSTPDQAHCVGIESDNYQAGEILSPIWVQNNFSSGTLEAGVATINIPNLPGQAYLKIDLPHNTESQIIIWQGGTQVFITPTGRGFFNVTPGSSVVIGRSGTDFDGRYLPATPVVIGGTWSLYFTTLTNPDASNYAPRTIRNPFAAAVNVAISGSVNDTLLLNGIPVRSGTAFAPLSFHLGVGGTFTIAAASSLMDYPFYIGYDLAAEFTT